MIIETNPAGDRTARFSDDRLYRYELSIELGGTETLLALGLNPSTATHLINDQTIRKDIGFARLWGLGRLVKANAHGYRATKPKDMEKARRAGVDIVGADNDAVIRSHLTAIFEKGGRLLVAWGNHIRPERQIVLATMFEDAGVQPMCLGTNQNGTPVHELYQGYETGLRPWRLPQR